MYISQFVVLHAVFCFYCAVIFVPGSVMFSIWVPRCTFTYDFSWSL